MKYIPQNILTVADEAAPGWQEKLREAGISVEHRGNDDKYYCNDVTAAETLIASHDPLAYAKAQKVIELGEYFKARKVAGHTTATNPSIRINTTPDDVQDMIEAYLLSQADATQVFIFQDADQTWRSLNKAQTAALLSDYAKWKKAIAQNTQAIYQQIQSAATWQEVQAIDVTANWPG